MFHEQIPPEVRIRLAEYFNCPEEALDFDPRFSKGRSGDEVYLLTVSGAANMESNGEYILKIKKKSSAEEFDREVSNTHSAAQKNQSEKIRVPALQIFSQHSGYYVYDVAGTGAKETSELCSQAPEKKRSRFRDLIDASFFIWNNSVDTGRATASEMVRGWLGEARLAPDARLAGRVRGYIQDELQPAWRMEDTVYPNPYRFFTCAPDDEPAFSNVLRGPQHGDMNQSNILIQPCGQGFIYYLIDFSHYQDQTFLLYDQAYLLLDILLDIDGMLLTDWLDHLKVFFDLVVDPGAPFRAGSEFEKYAEAFIGGWKRYFSRYPQNGRVMAIQMLCACAAAGLNFLNKAAALEHKQIFGFAFASAAVKKLTDLGVGAAPDPDGEYPALSAASADGIFDLWKITRGFSRESKYILMTSCLPEDYPPEIFGPLGAVSWAAVIEINNLLDNRLRNAGLRQFRKREGYSHLLLPNEDEPAEVGKNAVWCSILMGPEERNQRIFYRRSIQSGLSACLNRLLAQYEKYPLCILVDSSHLDRTMYDLVVTDLIVAAGENTPIDLIDLSGGEIPIAEEGNLRIHQIPCTLPEIAMNIRTSFRSDERDEIRIPTANGLATLERSVATEIEIDMQIIHRGLLDSADDDGGEEFYHGGEPTWHDIAYHRDADRLDYTNKWRAQIQHRMSQLHASTTSIIWLYHKPGGGGSTMAKRIMWDFCLQYPTVRLRQISEQTAERLKTLYRISINMPLLIVAEINDNAISSLSLSLLRMDLIKKNVRACFICVQRRNECPKEDLANFYLPGTPMMTIPVGSEEARDMYRKFSSRLDGERDLERIKDLNDLTFSEEYSDEVRQPFFYGLFTYGENYRRIGEYVKANLHEMSKEETQALEILAFNTIYSQGVNLNLQEMAAILFPGEKVTWDLLDRTRSFLNGNCFIIPREGGYRVSHPLIARALLEHLFANMSYTSSLMDLAKLQVNLLGALYGYCAVRLDDIFHELFIHREPITEDQRSVFSNFIKELHNDQQRIGMMNYLREKFPENPHYSNHLARLYLYPQNDAQWANIPLAKKYADEAIKRAEKQSQDSGLIHHHLMGKIYTRECVLALRKDLRRLSLSKALKQALPNYDKAFIEFNICSGSRNIAYGLVGKLELINQVLKLLKKKGRIQDLMRQDPFVRNLLIKMTAEAGNIIQQYTVSLDTSDVAFQKAALNFYTSMDRISRIESLFGINEANLSLRANSRRSIVTIYESEARSRDSLLLYDNLSKEKLEKIKDLMAQNIFRDTVGTASDRFRWLEAARRLDSFSLPEAYAFVQDWPDSGENLDVAYFRYVLAFLFYAKYQGVSYRTVREHLTQCQKLAQQAYGKYTSVSKDLCGKLDDDIDRNALIPWQSFTRDADSNQEYRRDRCEVITGSVSAVRDGMIDFRFSMEQTGSSLFTAKAPVVDTDEILLEGMQVKFHLAFSYTGFRAWDITPLGEG